MIDKRRIKYDIDLYKKDEIKISDINFNTIKLQHKYIKLDNNSVYIINEHNDYVFLKKYGNGCNHISTLSWYDFKKNITFLQRKNKVKKLIYKLK